MPLSRETIVKVTRHVERALSYFSFQKMFSFIKDSDLKERLAKELYMARYVYKLQEALFMDEDSFQLLATAKFQIIQYASIMEAIVSYILQQKEYWDSQPVKEIRCTSEYKNKRELTSVFLKEDEEEKPIYLCTKKETPNDWKYISFEKKVKAAAKNQIIKNETSERAIEIYKLRNNLHIEKAAKSDDEYTLESAKDAFTFLTTTFLKEIAESLRKEPDAEQEQATEEITENYQENFQKLQDLQRQNKPTLMSQLKSIQIDAPEDFAANLDLYLSGEKSVE